MIDSLYPKLLDSLFDVLDRPFLTSVSRAPDTEPPSLCIDIGPSVRREVLLARVKPYPCEYS